MSVFVCMCVVWGGGGYMCVWGGGYMRARMFVFVWEYERVCVCARVCMSKSVCAELSPPERAETFHTLGKSWTASHTCVCRTGRNPSAAECV